MKKINYKTFAAAVIILCLAAGCSGKTGSENVTESGIADTTVVEDSASVNNGAASIDGDSASTNKETESKELETEKHVIFGDERSEVYLPLLEGKRVALFSNQTGIVGNRILNAPAGEESAAQNESPEAGGIPVAAGEEPAAQGDTVEEAAEGMIPFGINIDGTEAEYGEHILDSLIRQGVDVEVVFSPEHGFRGNADAGEHVSDTVDEQTGVPVRSLYGRGAKGPAAEDMELFDVLVVDIQDVGLRYYTYYITMYYLMDACAAAGKEVVILDRPNPNGFYMDGPVLEEEFVSGVGKLPVPVVHGMTLGELAQMINGEGWLTSGKDACDLTVVSCDNYTHATKTSLATRPSPNLKDMRAVYLYASTCFFENTAFSVGRGTEFPFEVYGSPYLTGGRDYEDSPDLDKEEQDSKYEGEEPGEQDPNYEGEEPEEQNSDYEAEEPDPGHDTDGVSFSFTPVSMDGATAPPFEGQVCYGRDLRTIPLAQILQEGIDLEYVIDAWRLLQEARPDISFFGTPDDSGRYWIDKLCGTDRVRHMIEDGCSAQEIKASWQEELEAFRVQRRPYLLYEE